LGLGENDADELKQELVRLGFDKVVVMKGSDAEELAPTTPERILAQLDRLLTDVGKRDIVLVSLSGHDQQHRVRGDDGKEHDDGFFCPVNAVLNDPKTMLSLSDLTDKVLSKRGGKNLVTLDQWRKIMGTRVQELGSKAASKEMCGEGPNNPIYVVSHTEAQEFCRKLTESERGSGGLPAGWSYRLPTEAEWEYACRAGTQSATAFGDQLSSQDANFNGNDPYNGAPNGPNQHSTTAVGKYRSNAWGALRYGR
jgi:hypothetical protein